MNRNVRIAKQLVRLAKSLVASDYENQYNEAFQELMNKAKTDGVAYFDSIFKYENDDVVATMDGMGIVLDFKKDMWGNLPESKMARSSIVNDSVRGIVRGEEFQSAFNDALTETMQEMEEWDEWQVAASRADDLVEHDEDYESYGDGIALLGEEFDGNLRQDGVFMPCQDVTVKINGKEVEGDFCWTYNMWGGGAWG